MAKFKTNDLLKELHGKHCMHSDTYYAQRYGTNYTGVMCNENPRNTDPTPGQATVRSRFATTRANVAALTDAEVAAYVTAFKAQKKYRALQGYIFAMEYAKIVAAASANDND